MLQYQTRSASGLEKRTGLVFAIVVSHAPENLASLSPICMGDPSLTS